MKYVRKRERGQGLSEYALILVLVGIVVIVALTLFGEQLRSYYECAIDRKSVV
jgi:Flp pilus assembly pilin Flp